MNIVEIIQKLLEYLKENNGSRRTCDAMEESMELLKQDLPEEKRNAEIKRVGDTISFLLEQEKQKVGALRAERQEKQRFSVKIKRLLEECRKECLAMAERKSFDQLPLRQRYEGEFLTEMSAQMNGEKMNHREKFSELVRREYLRLSDSLRPVIKEFTESVMDEYEFCMEKVRDAFSRTKIEVYHTSLREMNETILLNYDTMQKKILSETDAYEYPAEQFDRFAEETSVKLERVAKRAHIFTVFLKLLPVLIYLVKYIVDHYIIQRTTWMDRIMDVLISWMEKAIQNDVKGVISALEMILQFAADHAEGFTFTAETLLLFIFAGWLYYIYVKIISHVRKKSLYTKQQAIIRPEAEKFLRELSIKDEIFRTLAEIERKIAEQYMQKHRSLFEKIMQNNPQEEYESELYSLQAAFFDYVQRTQ